MVDAHLFADLSGPCLSRVLPLPEGYNLHDIRDPDGRKQWDILTRFPDRTTQSPPDP
jgi:hypothetical protein